MRGYCKNLLKPPGIKEKVDEACLLCVLLALGAFPVPSETVLFTGVQVGWLLLAARLYSMAVNNSPATNRHANLLTADLLNQAVSFVPCIVNCCRAIKYSLYVVNANYILQKIYCINLVVHSSHAKSKCSSSRSSPHNKRLLLALPLYTAWRGGRG